MEVERSKRSFDKKYSQRKGGEKKTAGRNEKEERLGRRESFVGKVHFMKLE